MFLGKKSVIMWESEFYLNSNFKWLKKEEIKRKSFTLLFPIEVKK